MNNQHFRDLLQKSATTEKGDGASRASALGAKRSAFVPMTPRPGHGNSASNADFARQVREQHAGLQPTKKFKSSAPKGSKLGDGYTDRAKERAEAQRREEEEKAKRIRALEQQVKLGTLPAADFEHIREKILADADSGRPQVKGLDRKLLERTRRGEDILDTTGAEKEEDDGDAAPIDVEDALDKLGAQEVQTVARTAAEKVGTKATAAPVAGVKRTRDEIMAELKAKRQRAAQEKAAAAPVFDHRWRKVGEQAKPRLEIDHKGREVLITVDEDGIVKRMVRKPGAGKEGIAAPSSDSSKPVLGADYVLGKQGPAQHKRDAAGDNDDGDDDDDDDDDGDIFAGVGTEYNPLGEEEEDGSSSGDEVESAKKTTAKQETRSEDEDPNADKSRPGDSTAIHPQRRNYFTDEGTEPEQTSKPNYKDVENIIKKAAQIGATISEEVDEQEKMRAEKRAQMLARDRDMDDLDLGFGSSRFEDDEDDGPAGKGRNSDWKRSGKTGDDGWEEGGHGDGKKKRKPKKRKGDVNNIDDVMRVLDGRRSGAKS